MKSLIYILAMITLISCGSSKVYTEQEQQAYQKLKQKVQQKNFEIVSHTARPMASVAFSQIANSNILGIGNSASNINIIGNSNKLTFKGDSISGHFPYFGDQQFGSGFPGTNHQGIEFKGIPDDYKIKENDAKHSIVIQFEIKDQYRNNENYNVFVTLFLNEVSSIQINSTNRSSIEFSGNMKRIVEENK